MRKFLLTIMTMALLIIAANTLSVHAAEVDSSKSDPDLVSMEQQSLGEYKVDVKVKLPETELGNIKTFVLKFKLAGYDVKNPVFKFAPAIARLSNTEIPVQTFNHKDGIFSVYISGTATIFEGSGSFVDLGTLTLLEKGDYTEAEAPKITVTIEDFQIVSSQGQRKLDLDYDDAADSVTLEFYNSVSALKATIEKAGELLNIEGYDLNDPQVAVYDALKTAYDEAKQVDEGTAGDAARTEAEQKLSAAIAQLEPVHELLHEIGIANISIEENNEEECPELVSQRAEAVTYLMQGNITQEATDLLERKLEFENTVVDLRITYFKSNVPAEDKGKYTSVNYANWETAYAEAGAVLASKETAITTSMAQLAMRAEADKMALDTAYSELVDVTTLKEVMALVQGMLDEERKYTAASIERLKKAQAAGNAFLTKAETERITSTEYYDVEQELSKAVSEAVERSTTDDLKETLEEAKAKLAEAGYTPESYEILSAAIKEAQAVLDNDNATVDEVSNAVNLLENAMNAMSKIADTTQLKALIRKVDNYIKEDHASDNTQSSYDALLAALKAAKAVLEDSNASQDEVEKACEALDNAANNLVSIVSLKESVTDAEAVKKADYTAESYAAFQKALEQAKNVLNDKNATQDEVDAALKALKDAKNNLKVDKTGLENKVQDLEKEAIVPEDYTAESYEAFQEALAYAREVLSSSVATQTEINDALDRLEDASKGLVKVNHIAVSDLKSAVEDAEKRSAGDYTKDSYDAMQAALETAKEVLGKTGIGESELKQAYTALKEALNALVSTVKLQEAVKAAESLNEGDYTKESYDAVLSALKAARNVLDNSKASQEDVNSAVEVLTKAMENLVKAPGESSSESTGEASGSTGEASGSTGEASGSTGEASESTGEASESTGEASESADEASESVPGEEQNDSEEDSSNVLPDTNDNFKTVSIVIFVLALVVVVAAGVILFLRTRNQKRNRRRRR